GNGMIGGEEVAVILELLARGFTGRWVRDAAVRHYIAHERQTIRYLRRYYTGLASTGALLGDDDPEESQTLFGRPRWAWRAVLQYEAAYRLHRLVSSPEVWIEDLKRASFARGALKASERRSLPGAKDIWAV
ncbi:MAG: hypothetical protein ABI229_03295, partial [Gemmatimonadaceae bacterium]